MDNIEIIPLEGIKFNDVTIPLSASRKYVESLLGVPYGRHENSLFYFHNELRFDSDNNESW